MTKPEAIKYLKSYGIFVRFNIERLSRGNNSDVFLITSGGKKYVLRSRRPDSRHENLLLNHFINLKFLEAAKINFAPRSIHFDPKHQLLLASYLPGCDTVERGLTAPELKLLAQYLVQINKLSYKLYQRVCRQWGHRASEPETPSSSIRKFGVKGFNYIKNYCVEKDIVYWIKPRLLNNVKYLDSIKWGPLQIGFNHGDLTGANIIAKGKNLYIIDWERARFTYSSDFGLGYMLMHFEFFLLNQYKLIKLVAQIAKQSETSLKERVNQSMRGVKINDVIWAAQAYSELRQKNQRGWKKYRQMTYNRIKEYEELFEVK